MVLGKYSAVPLQGPLPSSPWQHFAEGRPKHHGRQDRFTLSRYEETLPDATSTEIQPPRFALVLAWGSTHDGRLIVPLFVEGVV